MVPHICWIRYARKRIEPWNVKHFNCIFSEIIAGFSQPSTRRLILSFASCYWFSPFHTHFTYRKCICQHSAIAKTTVKQRSFALILFDFQHKKSWLRWHHRFFSAVNTRVTHGILNPFNILHNCAYRSYQYDDPQAVSLAVNDSSRFHIVPLVLSDCQTTWQPGQRTENINVHIYVCYVTLNGDFILKCFCLSDIGVFMWK